MTVPAFAPSQLRKTKWWEYLVRFLFGGAVTLATGLIANSWGPTIAGLFLAFPAILPASLTLVQQHDGHTDAIEDARGARLGAFALIAFAVVVWCGATVWPPAIVLLLATLAWSIVAVALWVVLLAKSSIHR